MSTSFRVETGYARGVYALGVAGELDQATGEQVATLLDRVNADGTWVLPNIPANTGRVNRVLHSVGIIGDAVPDGANARGVRFLFCGQWMATR